MSRITKQVGFLTEDGRMFTTLDEAAEHLYSSKLKTIIPKATFGVQTIIQYAKPIHEVLSEYLTHIESIEHGPKD